MGFRKALLLSPGWPQPPGSQQTCPRHAPGTSAREGCGERRDRGHIGSARLPEQLPQAGYSRCPFYSRPPLFAAIFRR